MFVLTIKDIARISGCAVSTVSRALNDHPDVSAETKQRINEIVEQTGFVPNSNARHLKVRQSRNVSIIVKGAFNLFFAGVLERMQFDFTAAGYNTLVHYLHEDDDEVLVCKQLQRENKPLGFLFLGGNIDSFREQFKTINVPSVLATTVCAELGFENLTCVGIDDTAAGGKACEYLVQKGHKNIAVIGGKTESSYISAQRYDGFCEAYQLNFNVPHSKELYEKCRFSTQDGYNSMKKLLESDKVFSSVFCMSDVIAIGAIRAALDKGLKVPHDLSIIGFDGIEFGQYFEPRLTTIRQPQQLIAKHSVKSLIRCIEKNKKESDVVLDCELIEGDSVAVNNS